MAYSKCHMLIPFWKKILSMIKALGANALPPKAAPETTPMVIVT